MPHPFGRVEGLHDGRADRDRRRQRRPPVGRLRPPGRRLPTVARRLHLRREIRHPFHRRGRALVGPRDDRPGGGGSDRPQTAAHGRRNRSDRLGVRRRRHRRRERDRHGNRCHGRRRGAPDPLPRSRIRRAVRRRDRCGTTGGRLGRWHRDLRGPRGPCRTRGTRLRPPRCRPREGGDVAPCNQGDRDPAPCRSNPGPTGGHARRPTDPAACKGASRTVPTSFCGRRSSPLRPSITSRRRSLGTVRPLPSPRPDDTIRASCRERSPSSNRRCCSRSQITFCGIGRSTCSARSTSTDGSPNLCSLPVPSRFLPCSLRPRAPPETDSP